MSYLIEKDGERQCVTSLDGYADWTVLAEGEAAVPVDFATFVNGAWLVDEAAKAEAERKAAILAADPIGRFDELQARIAELEAMVQVMAPLVEQTSGVSLETGAPLA